MKPEDLLRTHTIPVKPAPASSRRRHLAALVGLVGLACVPLHALAQPQGSPGEVADLLGARARLWGQSRLRFLGLHVYDARLWVGDGFDALRYDAGPLALELQYARALSGRQIARRSIDEMRRGGPLAEHEEKAWLAFMEQAFPDVREGDRITGLWQPRDRSTRFVHNGTVQHTLSDARFGPRFFGIWLAPHSSEPQMRAQLLRLGDAKPGA